MTDITLHTKSKSTVTCVSNTFIDEYMADANGEFVKIYLYLLRCINAAENFSISKMADKFDHTEKDIKRALKYWDIIPANSLPASACVSLFLRLRRILNMQKSLRKHLL